MTSFQKWIKQPSTITGIGVACATAAGFIAKAVSGDVSWGLAAGGVVAAGVHLVMPDNSAVMRPVEQFVADAVEAGVTKRWQQEAPQLIRDGVKVADAVAAATDPAKPATTQETKK